jgi:hypothetical protein
MLIRVAALILGTLGSMAMGYVIGVMLVMQAIMAWTMMWSDTSWFATAIGLLTPAIILYLLDRRIARWLIPVPRRECHECGYPLRGLRVGTTRCPECGTPLSAPSASADSNARR